MEIDPNFKKQMDAALDQMKEILDRKEDPEPEQSKPIDFSKLPFAAPKKIRQLADLDVLYAKMKQEWKH